MTMTIELAAAPTPTPTPPSPTPTTATSTSTSTTAAAAATTAIIYKSFVESPSPEAMAGVKHSKNEHAAMHATSGFWMP